MGGAAAAGMVGELFGMVGDIVSAHMSSSAQKSVIKKQIKSQERIHEESAAERQRSSQMARADAEIAQKNLLQSEQARLNILTSLGQPGTYGPGIGDRTGPISLGILAPTKLSGLYGSQQNSLSAAGRMSITGSVDPREVALRNQPRISIAKKWETTGVDLDPAAMAAEVKSSAGFRTVSRMVAEAEQLMNREGPLWDQLNNSIVGGIYESNATFQRQAMEQVARNLARGGTARRAGLQVAQAMQVQEGINRQRTNQLWQAKLSLEEFRSSYGQQVQSFSQAWVSNHAGIRDAFTTALNNLQMHWASTMAPVLAGATVGAQSATQQGIANASQGAMQAIATSANAMSGAFQSIQGIGQQVLGYGLSQMGASPTIPASYATGSASDVASGGAGAATSVF